MAKIRDRMWLWGQDPGTHHTQCRSRYNLPGENKMTSIEGCRFFGIPNCCRVEVCGKPEPPLDGEANLLDPLENVVWSVLGAGHVYRTEHPLGDFFYEIIRIAKQHKNVVGGIFDDFFSTLRMEHFTPGLLTEIRTRLSEGAGRRLDLWVVLYVHQLGLQNLKAYLDAFDVITMWTWNGRDLFNLDLNFEKLVELTPGKRRLAGLYMWNYGEEKPLTREQMDIQFDRYYKMMKNRTIEGVVLCSNCIADIGIEAVEWTKQWLDEIGDEAL